VHTSSKLALSCLLLLAAACGGSSSTNGPGSNKDATAPSDGSSAEAASTTDATEDVGSDATEVEEAGMESGTPDAPSGEAGGADAGDAGSDAASDKDGGETDAANETDAADGGHIDASVDAGSETDASDGGQAEASVDAGIACSPYCAVGHACLVDGNCNVFTSGVCGADKKCAAATCSDGVRNQGESGIDCGGPCDTANPPQLCQPGDGCYSAPDCVSGTCLSDDTCGPLRANGKQCNYIYNGSTLVNYPPGCASDYCNSQGNCAACTMPSDCTSGKCSDAGVCSM
jgi:hypothetical protein